jgi:hypothetical protein
MRRDAAWRERQRPRASSVPRAAATGRTIERPEECSARAATAHFLAAQHAERRRSRLADNPLTPTPHLRRRRRAPFIGRGAVQRRPDHARRAIPARRCAPAPIDGPPRSYGARRFHKPGNGPRRTRPLLVERSSRRLVRDRSACRPKSTSTGAAEVARRYHRQGAGRAASAAADRRKPRHDVVIPQTPSEDGTIVGRATSPASQEMHGPRRPGRHDPAAPAAARDRVRRDRPSGAGRCAASVPHVASSIGQLRLAARLTLSGESITACRDDRCQLHRRRDRHLRQEPRPGKRVGRACRTPCNSIKRCVTTASR